MSDALLYELKVIMQRDVNNRGLATVPDNNLFTACKEDFAAACRSLATTTPLNVGIVTGFWIPSAGAAETDGPFGALFLARVLHEMGAEVTLLAEEWCAESLRVGLQAAGVADRIKVNVPLERYTHLLAIERVGPSHTLESFLAQTRQQPAPTETFSRVPAEHYDHCHTMRGQIMTEFMAPLHEMFENKQVTTIGIGDGGNEIGMGKIPWEVIATNVPGGAITACRVATDYNLVCGVSNWGAYALGAGVWGLTGKRVPEHLFNVDQERIIGEKIITSVNLVDGVTGQRTLSVDGLPWDVYSRPIAEMFSLLAAG